MICLIVVISVVGLMFVVIISISTNMITISVAIVVITTCMRTYSSWYESCMCVYIYIYIYMFITIQSFACHMCIDAICIAKAQGSTKTWQILLRLAPRFEPKSTWRVENAQVFAPHMRSALHKTSTVISVREFVRVKI